MKNECAEKADLNADLEEADQMLKLEEAKVVHAQNEMAQAKQELERRVAEKDDEIENVRKTYHKKLEAMQVSSGNRESSSPSSQHYAASGLENRKSCANHGLFDEEKNGRTVQKTFNMLKTQKKL